ncbi:ATP-binding protein [Veillonella magna]|uniref:ATP-binding protein n=1 Tax=Veillonella magna TaxID=464322 RepID=UPI0003F8E81D|nr:ATP-binding protein [Veillonella magna]
MSYQYLKKSSSKITITLPSSIDSAHVSTFINEIAQLNLDSIASDKSKYILLDARTINWIEPYASLLIIATLNSLQRKCNDLEIDVKSYKIQNFNGYAEHIGFYNAISLPYGKEIGVAPGSDSYIPIHKWIKTELEKEAKDKHILVQQLLEEEAYTLSKTLNYHNNFPDTSKSMGFALFEILRNVYEHSESETLWCCAQVWPQKDKLEIAVVDEGIGIKKSLASNKAYNDGKDNVGSILFALQPGVSKSYRPRKKHNPFSDNDDNAYANSGFGLYLTSQVCKDIGKFKICSVGNQVQLWKDNKPKITKLNFNGTGICININLSKLDQFMELKKQYLSIGEAEIKHKPNVIKEASAASKTIGPISKRFDF